MLPGSEINLYLLIFLSLASGVISGFVGVGGGFIMTPALIILGFPAHYAVGTSLLWVTANSIVGTLRHRRLGNVDIKLSIVTIVFMICGFEAGIRALTAAKDAGLADAAVLIVALCVMLTIGSLTFWESVHTKSRLDRILKEHDSSQTNIDAASLASLVSRIRIPPVIYFPKSNVRISLWVLMVIGLLVGTLGGFIGIGGGFVMVPSMVYLFGVPSFIAVGTSLCQVILPSAFATIRYAMEGSVIFYAALIMICGSSIGVYFGALLTKYLREISMRFILASTIFIAILGSILKLIIVIAGSESPCLHNGMVAVTFGGLALVLCMLVGLFIAATRHRKGKYIPAWTESLVRD